MPPTPTPIVIVITKSVAIVETSGNGGLDPITETIAIEDATTTIDPVTKTITIEAKVYVQPATGCLPPLV